MALILSLETSTDVCSVALHNDGELLKDIVVPESQAHAEKLAPAIRQLFTSASLAYADLAAVAITAGPGSYTGLRIGTSTAKGICFAMGLPLIAIQTLELMANQALAMITVKAVLCPMIDARRMEVYCQRFDGRLNALQPAEAKIIEEGSFNELLASEKMFFFGNGAEKCRTVIQSSNAFFLDDVVPLASGMGNMAIKKFENKEFEDLEHFKPFYLKEFAAKKAQSLLG